MPMALMCDIDKGAKPAEAHLDGLWLELTERCNLSCAHCCIRQRCDQDRLRANELDTGSILDIISEAVHLGCVRIEFTGGEPLLRPDFADIYLHAHSLGLRISVTSNITLLSERIAEIWKECPPTVVKISFYGWDELSYDSVVEQPGSFALFLAGMHRIADHDISFKALMPAHPTLMANAPQVRALATALGAEGPVSVGWELLLHTRRDPSTNSRIRTLRLSPRAAARQRMVFTKLVLDDINLICRGIPNNDQPHDRLFRCAAAHRTVAVDACGLLQPCRILRHPELMYDLTKGTLRDAVLRHLPRIREMRSENRRMIEQCFRCVLRPACSSCPATAWLENGVLDEPARYYCEIIHQEAYWLGLLPAGANGWEGGLNICQPSGLFR